MLQTEAIPPKLDMVARLFLHECYGGRNRAIQMAAFEPESPKPKITLTSLRVVNAASEEEIYNYVNFDKRLFSILTPQETCVLLSKLAEPVMKPDITASWAATILGGAFFGGAACAGDALINQKAAPTRRKALRGVFSLGAGAALGAIPGRELDRQLDEFNFANAASSQQQYVNTALRNLIGDATEISKTEIMLMKKLAENNVTIDDKPAAEMLVAMHQQAQPMP